MTRRNRGASVDKQHLDLITAMFEKVTQQMKRDHEQLISLLTSKFDTQVKDLQCENSELKAKLAALEERMVATQLHMMSVSTASNNDNNNIRRDNTLSTTINNSTTTVNHATTTTEQANASPGNDNSNSWTTVAKRRAAERTRVGAALRAKKMLQGANDNNECKLKSAPKREYPVKAFLTRIAAGTEASEVKEHINKMFSLDLSVEKLNTKHPGYSSFVIETCPGDIDKLLDGSKWPINAALRRWYEPKPRSTAANHEEDDATITNDGQHH